MNRRTFLKIGAAATVTAAAGNRLTAAAPAGLPEATAQKLPRWRGFNLLEKFTAPESRPFVEQDFEWLAFSSIRLGGTIIRPTVQEWGVSRKHLPSMQAGCIH